MFVITILNLYIVRLVLNGLGKTDFGIFNTIAGFVTTATIVNVVLAQSVQRFYSYAIGENHPERLREIFSASVNIVVLLTVVILLFMETAGLWFFDTQLVIPDARTEAAQTIYHIALATLVCSLAQIPFTAAIFANEDINIFAVISTIDVALKLVVACLIGTTSTDGLVFYCAGLLVVAMFTLSLYIVVAMRKYVECRYAHVTDREIYGKLLSFSGWTMLGSLSGIGMSQGNIILLDIVFGALATVPFAIAQQINNAFNALCNSMLLAFRPVMIKSYAAKQFDYLNELFSASNKFILYVLVAVGIPLFMEMRLILNLWLLDVSEQDVLFARLIIVYIICMAMHNPVTVIMQASGNLKQYYLPVESITILCVPVTWLLFRLGLPPYSVFFAMIGTCLLAHLVRLLVLRHFYPPFSLWHYFSTLVLPALVVVALATIVAIAIHTHIANDYARFAIVGISSPLSICLIVYLFGINSHERQQLRQAFMRYRSVHKTNPEPC